MDINFLGLEEKYTRYDTAKFCILPLPFERTTSYGKGTRFGPDAIIEASKQVELYDEELDCEPFLTGITTLEAPEFGQEQMTSEVFDHIYSTAKKLFRDHKFLFSLGGEHSVSYPLVRACREIFQNLTVLQFEAHADLRQEYMGSPDSHACVMARVHELARVIGVGIRSLSKEEMDRIRKDSFSVVFAHDMQSGPNWQEKVLSELQGDIYITFDVDYLDPAIMPSTGTPEPGGMFWRETIDFLRKVFSEKHVVGCDIVELAPQPGFPAPDFLAARLIYKMMGFQLLEG